MDFDNVYKYHAPKANQPERYEKLREKAKDTIIISWKRGKNFRCFSGVLKGG